MRRPGLGYHTLAAILLLALTAAGCATTPSVGVRPAFEQRSIPRVAVVPFYSIGTFSLSDEGLTRVLEASEQSAVETLRASGFEVVAPRAFREHLDDSGAAAVFDDGVLLRSELANYFEPASRKGGSEDLEVSTVRKLYEEGKLPAKALLFGELVYHTRTNCRVDPTDYNEYADVLGPTTEQQSCVVSHFQAKLVYAPTGETMWFNRRLVQTHVGDEAPEADRQNLAQTVSRTLGGSDGLRGFRDEEQTAALEDE